MAAITLSVDEDLKESYVTTCRELGLSPSAAFNVFAKAVVREQAIPFRVSARGAEAARHESDAAIARALWESYQGFEAGVSYSRDDVRFRREQA